MLKFRRAPYGARGLKFGVRLVMAIFVMSRPVWGAWIEIQFKALTSSGPQRRAPYGARGLKSYWSKVFDSFKWSRPVWGAWIEIYMGKNYYECDIVAPRMGRVD